MQFEHLRLTEPLLKAVRGEGYRSPTPIQQQAIPHALDGRDLLGCAQTGTGKTAAFALPILQNLGRKKPGRGGRRIRSLILTPTRELAAQIGESFQTYGRHTPLRHAVIFGGVKQTRQVQAIQRGVDILVATPGRLLDLLGQKILGLDDVEVFVLDEADRMLDMGFIPDIRRVVKLLPDRRQTLLFSATMPKEIAALAESLLTEPVKVEVPAESLAADTVDQSLYFVDRACKMTLLEQLFASPKITRALVFTRTKWGADKVARKLNRADITAAAIHGRKSQAARTRALAAFKAGSTRVLVASDIAARGLDVEDISHVINFDLPHEAETYVHRIGRTGRAGARGKAISFCSEEQRDNLRTIEKLLGRTIRRKSHSVTAPPAPAANQNAAGGRNKAKARSVAVSAGPRAGATPEQQQTEFWHRKKTKRKPASAQSARRRRRRR